MLSLNAHVIVVNVIHAFMNYKVVSFLSSKCVVIISANRWLKHSEICVCFNLLALLQKHGKGGWRATLICRFINIVFQMFNSVLFLHISFIRVSWKLVIGGIKVTSSIGFNENVVSYWSNSYICYSYSFANFLQKVLSYFRCRAFSLMFYCFPAKTLTANLNSGN